MTATDPRPTSPQAWAEAILLSDDRAGLLRRPRCRQGGSHLRGDVDGRTVTVFSSNDYLGLAVHPRVREAASRAALWRGVGATGSRHLSGCHAAIVELEAALCGFAGADSATLAPTGYAANVAAVQALGGPDAVVFSDAGNHASIIDGCRASRSPTVVYVHRDLDDLAAKLGCAEGRPVIVSDTIFSTDGAAADLGGLDELARRHGAWLLLDEAHAIGVLGPGGRGLADAEAVRGDHVVRVVTMSKALGAGGGAILASRTVRQLLLQRGRALIFSTALPHPTVAAAAAALRVIVEQPELVTQLQTNARRLRQALGSAAMSGGHLASPVVAVLTRDPGRTMELERCLFDRGFLVQGLRPPTVAPGTSRLRLTASALHRPEEIDAVAAAILDLL